MAEKFFWLVQAKNQLDIRRNQWQPVLEFSVNNGMRWKTIFDSAADNGTYSWTVPLEACTECLIRIADRDGVPSDVSDAVFTIHLEKQHA